MCVYCYCGDSFWKYDPPFYPKPDPLLPNPAIWPQPQPYTPWSLEKLKEYLELLKQIKALEDQIGCPCEPSKADHIKILMDRIAELEKKAKCKCGGQSPCKCGTITITFETNSNPPPKVT